MSNKLMTAVALAITLTSSAFAADKMNDLEIAHTAYTAGNLDIRYAHLALAITDNDSVRQFAELMIRDHSAVNEQAVALITKLKVTPKDNALSQALVKGAAENRAAFIKLSGKEFDCAYAKNELGYHQLVNKTVEGSFIPAVTVPELKDLLTSALATFKVHEGHAAEMVKGLSCS
jgi:putative membrane protein